MGSIKIIDNLAKFTTGYLKAVDRALNGMAIDIERLSKAVVPFKKGQLKSSGTHRRVGFLVYHTIFNMEYARFQEFGGDDKRVVRHYTYPGKKKFYLRDSGNQISKNALQYFLKETKKIKI